jgi:DNA transformation protein and related proteins
MHNIGKEVEKKFEQAGIKTPSELRIIGSKNAYLRIQSFYPEACQSLLCALESAIQEFVGMICQKKLNRILVISQN